MDPRPRKPVWWWFVFHGPHGETFSWGRKYGHRDVDLLREFIHAREASSPGFLESARAVALKAITLPEPVMIRTAIQVLCVIGTDDDLKLVYPLSKDSRESIRVDARCCLFERGVKDAADAG